MNNLSYQSYCDERCPDQCCTLIEFGTKSNTALSIKASELLHASASDCCGGAGITSGALSSSYHSAISNAHSLNFIGVNCSAVIATGSLSSKSMHLLSTWSMDDIHGVSGINLADLVPSECDGVKGIDNSQTFIIEDNFRMNKSDIEKCADDQSPSNAGQATAQSVIKKIDVCESAHSKECDDGHDNTAAGTKDFTVSHTDIFSCKKGRAA